MGTFEVFLTPMHMYRTQDLPKLGTVPGQLTLRTTFTTSPKITPTSWTVCHRVPDVLGFFELCQMRGPLVGATLSSLQSWRFSVFPV